MTECTTSAGKLIVNQITKIQCVSQTVVFVTPPRLNSRVNANTTVIRLAQICLRNDDPLSARLAFEAALRINPQLTQVRIAVEELRRAFPTVLH
jgi:hypothetical protein